MSKISLFDFRSQIAFYGEYHNNPINQWIHITCVPLITFTALVFLNAYPLFPTPAGYPDWLIFSPALLVVAVYFGYYVTLEAAAGTAAGLFYLGLWVGSCYFINNVERALFYSVVVHVVSWVLQFVGHGVAEKRKPTLLDNLPQAFLLAPFFVLIEVLFKLGYRPALAKEVQAEIDKRIASFKATKAN